jgi:hypothetical protein
VADLTINALKHMNDAEEDFVLEEDAERRGALEGTDDDIADGKISCVTPIFLPTTALCFSCNGKDMSIPFTGPIRRGSMHLDSLLPSGLSRCTSSLLLIAREKVLNRVLR